MSERKDGGMSKRPMSAKETKAWADLERAAKAVRRFTDRRKPDADAKRGMALSARYEACVNALAGIPDPERFVSAVRAAVAAGAVDEIYLTLIRNAMEGGK